MIVFFPYWLFVVVLGGYVIVKYIFPFIDSELTELTKTKGFPFNILVGVLAVIGTLIWSFNY